MEIGSLYGERNTYQLYKYEWGAFMGMYLNPGNESAKETLKLILA